VIFVRKNYLILTLPQRFIQLIGTPKKSFTLSILMLFYAQSYAFIGSKHSDYATKV